MTYYWSYKSSSDSYMTKEEKIKKIQDAFDQPGTMAMYYKLLEDMGDIKYNYHDYMITGPINCDTELERLPDADYELSTALLTMLLREDHFCEGAFMKRYEDGQVEAVLRRMIETLRE